MVAVDGNQLPNVTNEWCGGGLSYSFVPDSRGGMILESTEIAELSFTSIGKDGISALLLSQFLLTRGHHEEREVQSVSISPLVITLLEKTLKDSRKGFELGPVRPVQMTLEIRSTNIKDFSDSRFFNWATEVPINSMIKVEALDRSLSNGIIIDCIPSNWSGFWMDRDILQETVVAQCQVLSISNTSDPTVASWFSDILSGRGTDGHRDIAIEVFDSNVDSIEIQSYLRSLPSVFVFPLFDVSSRDALKESYVFKPESLNKN